MNPDLDDCRWGYRRSVSHYDVLILLRDAEARTIRSALAAVHWEFGYSLSLLLNGFARIGRRLVGDDYDG